MDGKGRYLGFNKYKHQKQDPIAQPGKLGDEINE
jgi:hypothetical protein